MAKYFVSATEASPLSRLTRRTGSETLSVVDDGGTTAIQIAKSVSGLTIVSVDDAGSPQEAEVYLHGRSTDTGGNQKLSAIVRGDTDSNAFGGGDLGPDDEIVTRYDAGTRNTAGTAFGVVADITAYHHIRFRVATNGATSDLKCKMWDGAVGDEPASWDIEIQDATFQNGGFAGFGVWASDNILVTGVGVGTGGDTAPTETVEAIDNVDTDNTVLDGQEALEINGTGLGGVDGVNLRDSTGTYVQAQTVDTATSTKVTLSGALVRGSVPFTSASHAIEIQVLESGTPMDTHTVTFNPASGFTAVEISGDTGNSKSLSSVFSDETVANGDQWLAPTTTRGDATLTVKADGTFETGPDSPQPDFLDDVDLWTAAGGGWSGVKDIEVTD